MNIVDIIIVLLVITALFRGSSIGFVRQLLSTAGFFIGFWIGVLIQPHVIGLIHSTLGRTLLSLLVTVGLGFVLLAVGEYFGIILKNKVHALHVDSFDNFFGSIVSAITVLLVVWLSASVFTLLPFPALQSGIRDSKIVSALSNNLPAAPDIIAGIGHFIDPNGFPQVFTNGEPSPPTDIKSPSLAQMRAAINADKKSIVKIEGQGCGGIVEGSGFVVGADLVATNAHVIAGLRAPNVIDANGTHLATPIWFDPDLDFAVLRVSHLAGKPLVINNSLAEQGTPSVVLGYPGGGNFEARAAAVLDQFTATGRNIYNQGSTERDVYEIQADIIPGNSGGPVVEKDGSVIGVVFAASTSYNHVGYALTAPEIISEINQAAAQDQAVNTASCAAD